MFVTEFLDTVHAMHDEPWRSPCLVRCWGNLGEQVSSANVQIAESWNLRVFRNCAFRYWYCFV